MVPNQGVLLSELFPFPVVLICIPPTDVGLFQISWGD